MGNDRGVGRGQGGLGLVGVAEEALAVGLFRCGAVVGVLEGMMVWLVLVYGKLWNLGIHNPNTSVVI